MSKPKISIVIPVYNTESFLSECIESVMQQTLQEIEIIVVNDCSPGNCKEIIEQYKKKDSRIVFVNSPKNVGTLQTRLAGFKIANGEFIQSLDSDDSILPNTCEMIYNQLQKTNADIAYIGVSRYIHPHKNHHDVQGKMFMPLSGEFLQQQWIENLAHTMNNCIWAYIVKKNVIEKLIIAIPKNVYVTKYDDVILVFLLSTLSIKKVIALPQKFYEYRIGTGIMHTTPSAKKITANFSNAFCAFETVMHAMQKSPAHNAYTINRIQRYMQNEMIYSEYKIFFSIEKTVQNEVISLLQKENLAETWTKYLFAFKQDSKSLKNRLKTNIIALSKKTGLYQMLKTWYYIVTKK